MVPVPLTIGQEPLGHSTGDAGVYIITKTGQILARYSRENGLPISSFTRDCGMYVNDDGIIYIGAYNGMISFNEAIIKEANSSEVVRFSSLLFSSASR